MKKPYHLVDVLNPKAKDTVVTLLDDPENKIVFNVSERYVMYKPLEEFLEPTNSLMHLGINELSLVAVYDEDPETKERYLGIAVFKHLFDPQTPSVEGFTYVIGNPPAMPPLTTILGIVVELLSQDDVQNFGISDATQTLISELSPYSEMFVVELLYGLSKQDFSKTLSGNEDEPDVGHLQ